MCLDAKASFASPGTGSGSAIQTTGLGSAQLLRDSYLKEKKEETWYYLFAS